MFILEIAAIAFVFHGLYRDFITDLRSRGDRDRY